jgi:hypothetical protein
MPTPIFDSKRTIFVCVLIIDHKHGRDIEVHASEGSALESLSQYASEYWDIKEQGQIPGDMDEVIEDYFNYHDGNEWWSITQHSIHNALVLAQKSV